MDHTGPDVAKSLEALAFMYFWTLWSSERMVEADDWIMEHYHADSCEEAETKYTRGSQERYHMDLVASFWELGGFLVATGRMDDTGFLEMFGGHPRTRWRKYEPMFRSARATPYRPESKRRAHYFEWLAERVEEMLAQGEGGKAEGEA